MAMYDGSSPQVIANPSLQSFFHQSVQGAINNQNLEASEASIQYLANLLTLTDVGLYKIAMGILLLPIS